MASPTTHHAEARGDLDGTSGRYMWEVHVDGMGGRWGKEPSYPTRPLPISELPPRHRAVALPSQPCVQQAPRWMSERGYLGGPGGQGAQARSGASFCKRHGGSVVRLRAVCEAKDVIVQLLPPSRQKYLLSPDVVGRLPCCG